MGFRIQLGLEGASAFCCCGLCLAADGARRRALMFSYFALLMSLTPSISWSFSMNSSRRLPWRFSNSDCCWASSITGDGTSRVGAALRGKPIMPLEHVRAFCVRHHGAMPGACDRRQLLRYMEEAAFSASAAAGYDLAATELWTYG